MHSIYMRQVRKSYIQTTFQIGIRGLTTEFMSNVSWPYPLTDSSLAGTLINVEGLIGFGYLFHHTMRRTSLISLSIRGIPITVLAMNYEFDRQWNYTYIMYTQKSNNLVSAPWSWVLWLWCQCWSSFVIHVRTRIIRRCFSCIGDRIDYIKQFLLSIQQHMPFLYE